MNAQFFSKERVLNNENFDKKRLSWGFILGFNNLDYKFTYNEPVEDIEVQKNVNFNVGLLSNLRINDYFDLRFEPLVIFSTRGVVFPEIERNNDREVKASYVYMPLLRKISTKRLNNFKPFLIGGVATAINLSSNERNPDDNLAGQFRTKTNVNFYELGVGIDFYLPYFKFSPSIRGIFATNNELQPDNSPDSVFTGPIDTMKTRGVFLNFTFQ